MVHKTSKLNNFNLPQTFHENLTCIETTGDIQK